MNTSVSAFDRAHQLDEPATRPIAGLPGAWPLHSQGVRRIRKPPKAATTPLLLLAGNDHARRRAPARGMPDSYALKRYDSATLPDNPAVPHSNASNRGI
jgi:hypothetical protein